MTYFSLIAFNWKQQFEFWIRNTKVECDRVWVQKGYWAYVFAVLNTALYQSQVLLCLNGLTHVRFRIGRKSQNSGVKY